MKKLVAGLFVLLLSAGGVALSASPASAHTGGVAGVAVCEIDGTYTVNWTYSATNVPGEAEAETKAMTTTPGILAPVDGVNKGGQIFLSVWEEHKVNVPGAPVLKGNWTGKFQTIDIPGDYSGAVTTMVQTDWKNGPSEDPVGKVIVDGSCDTPIVEVEKPADLVTVISEATPICEDRTLVTTVTTTTTGTELVNNVWVPTEPVITVETFRTPLTVEDCPVIKPPEEPVIPEVPVPPIVEITPETPVAVVPPVEPIPTVVTPVILETPEVVRTGMLANTGGSSDFTAAYVVGGIGLLLIGVVIFLMARSRKI